MVRVAVVAVVGDRVQCYWPGHPGTRAGGGKDVENVTNWAHDEPWRLS